MGAPATATRAAATANASPTVRRACRSRGRSRSTAQKAHTLNANRISALIPKPGEVEHWTLKNGGGGWDHPIHLHFEEGVTIDRGTAPIPATERLVRKDVWRLRPDGRGQGPGPLRRVRRRLCQPLPQHRPRGLRHAPAHAGPRRASRPGRDDAAYVITKTPIPTPNGVLWKDPEILPEGDPRTRTVAGR